MSLMQRCGLPRLAITSIASQLRLHGRCVDESSSKATPSVRELLLAMLARLVHAAATSRRPTAEPASSQIAAGKAPRAAGRQPGDAAIRRPAAARWACRKRQRASRWGSRQRLALADKHSAKGGRDAVVDAPTEHGPHHQTRPRRPAHLLVRGRATAENTDTTCKTAAPDPALAPVPLPRTKSGSGAGPAARAPAAARAHRDLAGAGPHGRIRRPRYASEVAADRGLDSF